MRQLLLTAFGLLACHGATAQATAAAPVSQWGWGIRAGLGQVNTQHGDSRHEYDESLAGPVVGLMATRYFAGPLVSLGVEALLSRNAMIVDYRQMAPFPDYGPQTLHQWRLFMPLYLRTAAPARRLHFLVGAGPTFALGRPGADAAYYVRPVELTVLLGIEVRVLPWHRYETTLGLRVHAPLTPSYAYGFPDSYTNPGAQVVNDESRRNVGISWVGFTLGTTLYPAAAR
ncbi:hypothetical protein [Hymenobacter terricola]|uniref:hypothetical protein n=1 Tax=Hymenobacter terricola TaxID=2819236 RepID=UPI001B313685|nr:hypothetical protein [Hymenobacter terricola]